MTGEATITDPYTDFLASKRRVVRDAGFSVDPSDLNPMLFPFQSDIVRWALRKGRAAVFADCGLGKGPISLEWARQVYAHTGGDVLILAPLAVAQQFVREAAKFHIEVTLCRTEHHLQPGINVTNYERLHLFDPDRFAGVVADECFAPWTPIDTPNGRQYIKDIRRGDVILNASAESGGWDVVSDVHRREVPYAVRITLNGQTIVSSPNHPYFTQRGWIGAQDLQPFDSLVPTAEAVRMVRGYLPQGNGTTAEGVEILRSILLSEMADAPAAIHREGPYSRSCEEEGREEAAMAGVRYSRGTGANRANTPVESYVRSSRARENLPHIEGDPASTFRAWGQRSWFDRASTDLEGCTRTDLGHGICFVTGQADSPLSVALQTRLSKSRPLNQHRSGWNLTPQPEIYRYEKGRKTTFTRVDRLEILEPGHPDLEQFRDADGRVYFYDIGCTWHPSFSVHGHLVHNSSILKSMDGKTRNQMIEMWRHTPFRLAGTATPAPNDHVELGNQAEFLGVCTRQEMLAEYFCHDGGDTSKWRLKGHAEAKFWEWACSWAVLLRKPSDLGYSDDGFILPPLNVVPRVIASTVTPQGMLFPVEAQGLNEQRQARRDSLQDRVDVAAKLVNNSTEQWLVWCDLNDESAALAKAIKGAVCEVRGTDTTEKKEMAVTAFVDGSVRVVISKPSIYGLGLNLQNCHNVIFVGVSHSYEAFYQAVRRSWRFGQTSPVNVYVVTSTAEGAVVSNLARKERDAQTMIDGMIAQTHEISTRILSAFGSETSEYVRDVAKGERWTAYLGDCVDVVSGLENDSIGYTIFSPPFASLYTYTDSDRDMGNVRDYTEFARHFRFLVKQLYRVTKPGRLVSFHCMDLPLTKSMGEEISLLDFPGYLIRMFQRAGFSWHSKVTIWKDPVTAMQRTHALGLLYKQLRKDSARSRQGVPDYLITMRKPGDNLSPVTKLEPTSAVVGQDVFGNETLFVPKSDEDYPEPYFPVELWQRYASPVWFDINPSDTLQRESAREAKDERHIAPLQKEVVRRAIRLWTNKGDLVLTPFLGIGTELFVAVEMGRRGVGAELKRSYWRQAVLNLQGIEAQVLGGDLFSWAQGETGNG